MKQFLLPIGCLLMFTIGCGKTEVAEQPSAPAPAPAPAPNVQPTPNGRTLMKKVQNYWLTNTVKIRTLFQKQCLPKRFQEGVKGGDTLRDGVIYYSDGSGQRETWDLQNQSWNQSNEEGVFYWGSNEKESAYKQYRVWAYKINVYVDNGRLVVGNVLEVNETYPKDVQVPNWEDLPYTNNLRWLTGDGGSRKGVEEFFQSLIDQASK